MCGHSGFEAKVFAPQKLLPRSVSRKLKSVVHVAQIRATELPARSSQTQGPLVGMKGPPFLEPCPARSRYTNR
jgi:hypothetical protein